MAASGSRCSTILVTGSFQVVKNKEVSFLVIKKKEVKKNLEIIIWNNKFGRKKIYKSACFFAEQYNDLDVALDCFGSHLYFGGGFISIW